MSPEYAMAGQFSAKSDVFSFGVLLLEIVTGIRNAGFSHHEDYPNLPGYVSIVSMLHQCPFFNFFFKTYSLSNIYIYEFPSL